MITISIILPCLNEERHISNCLDSIISSTVPKELIEVLIIDGMSTDETRLIIKNYINKYQYMKLINNPGMKTPAALNIGIKNAKGKFIIRMDGHTVYPANYISKCIEYLEKYDVANVGGVWKIMAGADTITARSIALALSSFFGAGNSYYKIGTKQSRYVDTVPFGCYKKNLFEKIGLFDEELLRGQDTEFNSRIIKNGGKILITPDIISFYYARDNFKKLWVQYFDYGYYKLIIAKKIGKIMTWRQITPPLFLVMFIVLSLLSILEHNLTIMPIALLTIYGLTSLTSSLFIAVIKKEAKILPLLILVYAIIHVSYGIGYLISFIRFFVPKKVA